MSAPSAKRRREVFGEWQMRVCYNSVLCGGRGEGVDGVETGRIQTFCDIFEGALFFSCGEGRRRNLSGQSTPEDGGNRGESTTTMLPMRNERWQRRHRKYQTTANRMTEFFFFFLNA